MMIREIIASLRDSSLKALGTAIASAFVIGELGVLMGLLSIPAWMYRDYIKHKAFNEYNNQTPQQRNTLTKSQRESFSEGCKSAQSTLDYLNNLSPASIGYSEPIAFYAGMLASEKASDARKANDPAKEVLLTRMIKSISPKAQ